MLAGLNLSRRDALSRVSQYVALWLVFWLLIGVAGQSRPGSSLVDQIAQGLGDTPAPPHLLDSTNAPDTSVVLRGSIARAVTTIARRAGFDGGKDQPAQGQGLGIDDASALTPQNSSPGSFRAGPPAGFEDLVGVQNTQADVYFQGRMIVSTFVEFDLEHLWFMAPEEVIDAIPTLTNPEAILAAISGKLANNSSLLCNVRVRTNCGTLSPEVAGIIFNESKFRVDLFVAPDELETQLVVGDRYLPAPSAGWGTLHDLSFSASGQFGRDQYNFSGESFLSRGEGRARVRYGLTNNGPSLHEAALQWDKQDHDYQFGAFRSARGSSLFVNDMRLLGVRFGTSTNTRTDLDNALATPIFLFIERRARVDILRDGEILDSRFYDAGNHQLDTTRLPDGAYDVTVKTVTADGREALETHFFVRDSLLPPLGEQQYFFEAGAFTQPYGSRLPRTTGGGWMRAGLSRRLTESFALETEALVSDQVSLLQGGAYFLGRGWQVHAGAMASERGDTGFSFRGQLQRKGYGLSFNAQRLKSKTVPSTLARFDPLFASNVQVDPFGDLEEVDTLDAVQTVLGGSYTQASASLSFPLRIPFLRGRFSAGRAHLRARYNQRDNRAADAGVGFSYFAPLFKRRFMVADLNVEGLYSNRRSLLRLGVDFRWRDRRQSSMVRPEMMVSRTTDGSSGDGDDSTLSPSLNAYWNRNHHTENAGTLTENVYLNHDNTRSVIGARLASQSKYGFGELDLSYQNGRQNGSRDGLAYATNSRFSLVSTEGRSTLGGGNSQLAAIVVEIDGDLPDAEFQVIVDSRVAGYASTGKRAVVSVRPYETYSVSVVPTGDSILGYDESSKEVTLYPGNVHRLEFAARSLHVLVSQAVLADGSPVRYGKFENVEGFGATDEDGWFQVELAHREPLRVRLPSGDHCLLQQPPLDPADENLVVVDALVCRITPAPPLN